MVTSLSTLCNGCLVSGTNGSSDLSIKIWDPNDGILKRNLTGHTGSFRPLTRLFNGDSVCGSLDKEIKIWNTCSN